MPYKNLTYKEYQHEYYIRKRDLKKEYYKQNAQRYYNENREKIKNYQYFCYHGHYKNNINIINDNIKIYIND